MQIISPIRGTYDLFGSAAFQHQHIVDTARCKAHIYGFQDIHTPIIESTDVFSRSVGDTSDIVSKEMYTFSDRNDHPICLRPEGTAGVMRAVLSNKLTQQVPLKFFYAGPMFRYERPQKGRYRQFAQIGVEHIGDDTPAADIECIKMAEDILVSLSVEDVILEIHTLGDIESRALYRDALVAYLGPLRTQLSIDSQARLGKNPLRILDSKSVQDQTLLVGAPKLLDFLTAEALGYFETVKSGLDALGVSYIVNPHLVRGLDYYSHTTFEFRSTSLGAQDTVLAGGRYNNLSRMLGGPDLPGVGWAAGVERISMIAPPKTRATIDVFLIPIGDDSLNSALQVARVLRDEQYTVEFSHAVTLKASLKRAKKVMSKWACLVGAEEIQAEQVIFKNLISGEQHKVTMPELVHFLGTQT